MKKITSKTYYETGIETPEILGSGSSFSSVITTTDENEAFQAYRSGNRNYLLRVTYSIDRPRKVERWDEEQKCWKRERLFYARNYNLPGTGRVAVLP